MAASCYSLKFGEKIADAIFCIESAWEYDSICHLARSGVSIAWLSSSAYDNDAGVERPLRVENWGGFEFFVDYYNNNKSTGLNGNYPY